VKIALFGHFLFHTAVGLRQNLDNDVRLFLDSSTLPTCLLDEPLLHDPSFVQIAPWVTWRKVLRPETAEITDRLSQYDIAIVTDLGPVFASRAGIEYVFRPGGSDLTQFPFPIRSRSTRSRGRSDVVNAIIAFRLRQAIRSASSIWGHPYSQYFMHAAGRLGLTIGGWLPQAIDTDLFTPEPSSNENDRGSQAITIFHPTCMQFKRDPFQIESGGWKRNDLLLRGFANAVRQGVDAKLVLISREGSDDQEEAKQLVAELGISGSVKWLTAKTPAGFTWREMVSLYRSSDLVVGELGGWLGLVALEGASCGKPVLNFLNPEPHLTGSTVELMYPAGHPFLQTESAEEVCNAITMLTNPDLRASIGRESRQWVVDHHERSRVAKRCESMLEELLAS